MKIPYKIYKTIKTVIDLPFYNYYCCVAAAAELLFEIFLRVCLYGLCEFVMNEFT